MLSKPFFKKYFPLYFTYFVDNFGLAIAFPIFTPLFLSPHFDLFTQGNEGLLQRTFLLALLIVSFPIAQFFGAPILGELSDRVGRKKVFLITILGGTAGYLLTGFGIYSTTLHLLWIGRLLTGLFAGNLVICLASIADFTKEEKERTKYFGWIATVGSISFITAIFVGGGFFKQNADPTLGTSLSFFLTAGLAIINFLLIYFVFEEKQPRREVFRLNLGLGVQNLVTGLKLPHLKFIYLIFFFFLVGWIAAMQFLSDYLLQDFTFADFSQMATFAFIGTSLVWAFANFVVNPILANKYPVSKTFTFSLIFLGLLFIASFLPQNFPGFIFLFLCASFFAALSWTNGLATISLNAPATMQGRILGTNQSISAIASIIGPICGGAIAGYDVHFVYPLAGILVFFAGIFFYHTYLKKVAIS
ncbi:MAG: MFS transporter [Chlamydiae bacterium]|nr:MFS transporter [Chlamydiota bacterium]